MHAFILAGGFATRLWPLTEQRAKPLLPLAGKPILTHLVEGIPADITVTVSTNTAFAHGFAEWKKTLGRENVRILVEKTTSDAEKLGALGAVAQWVAVDAIDEDVLLLTGDNYLGFPMQRLLDAYHPGTAILAAYDIGDRARASAFGTVVIAPGGHTISAFEEKPVAPR